MTALLRDPGYENYIGAVGRIEVSAVDDLCALSPTALLRAGLLQGHAALLLQSFLLLDSMRCKNHTQPLFT